MKLIENNIQKIIDLCKKHKVHKLFVFGSVLTSRFNDNSDVDLVVDFNKAEVSDYFDNFFDFKYALENLFGRKVDLLEEQTIKNPYLNKLAAGYFVDDPAFAKAFQFHSAAKSVHHGFVGGLLEHTLSVVKMCDYFAGFYKEINRDLLLTAAVFHDIGKTKELSVFPENDYTDDGQLLGHIIIGTEMVSDRIRQIPDFPEKLAVELKHCILAHHGELEYGSPKKPALLEAMALNLADNADAKMETMIEVLRAAGNNQGWLGYNRLLETNIRKTTEI